MIQLPVPTIPKENELVLSYYTPEQMQKAILEEREACLKACERNHFAIFAAEAIRARGQE